MKIGATKETYPNEARVAMTPESAGALQALGHTVLIETGAGLASGFTDKAYQAVGVGVLPSAQALCQAADVIVKVRPPELGEMALVGDGKTLVCLFNASENSAGLAYAAEHKLAIVALDSVPRISRAQKMDALSSMANIAGHRAVLEASTHFKRFFSGQITAAGKTAPANLLVIGAGVAGLAAIGAATSLGARTRAFDVRPEVAEQIESMGAEFVYLDFATGTADDTQDSAATGGYAAPSSPEFRAAQLAKFLELAPDTDIVITTALIPGRAAPVLWTEEMVAAMKHGSVIVDLAAERGGNCALTHADKTIISDNGVVIFGHTDLPSRMAAQASALYANNVRHMLADLTPDKDGVISHNMEDDVIRGATVAYGGEITFPPPPPKVQAIASAKAAGGAGGAESAPVAAVVAPTEAEIQRRAGIRQITLLAAGGALMAVLGLYAPREFLQHFVVFVLAVFVGFQVIWGVAHSLHTPLMSVTNAISGIIILGALLQVGADLPLVQILAAFAVGISAINVVGGFLVTRRMLQMFRKS